MDDVQQPRHLFVDLVEIVILFVVIVLGLTFNVRTLIRTLRKRAKTENNLIQRPRNRCHIRLKLHLNVCNLAVLLTYATGRFFWLITYQWLGGELLCKFYHFASLLTLQQTSLIMIAVAVHTLKSFRLMPNDDLGKRRLVKWISRYLIACWAVSALLSLSQWFVWTIVEPYQNFIQCASVWQRDEYLEKIKFNVTTEQMGAEENYTQLAYDMIHLICVFWLPFCIICYCYGKVGWTLLHRKMSNRQTVAQQQPRQSVNRRSDRMKNTALVKFGFITSIYLISWLPYNTLFLLSIFDEEFRFTIADELYFLHSLITLNCLGEPLTNEIRF